MRSGPEIQAALRKFIEAWATYEGTERAEAQTFLNELFACYGSDRKGVGAKFEHFKASAGFMDLLWPTVCIFEMKAPSRAKTLHQAREQVLHYWQESSDPDSDLPAARWVILCAFQRFEVWEPGRFPSKPRLSFDIEELADRYEALQFLSGPAQEPVFVDHYRDLTSEAAEAVATVYRSLRDRSAAPVDEVQRFLLQTVWTLFAEDLGMLDGHPLQKTVNLLQRDTTRTPAAELGLLFRVLNQKGSHNRNGLLAGTRYVNGDLFKNPSAVDLNRAELDALAKAAEYDWRKVNPTIFGSLMEGVLTADRRRELGAHYTHEADILKIVVPTISRPWRERIDAVLSPSEGRALLEELCAFTVLDPACGCGNFLYIAYRELRSLESYLKVKIALLSAEQGLPTSSSPLPFYPIKNLYGIEIEPISVLLTRVTLWMGQRQMIELYGEAEAPLPLTDLAGIVRGDALVTEWPATDCIIGNPPFLGDRNIRRVRGDSYTEWLSKNFGVGVKDYCVYWFRKAHEHLKPGQRAGLVGTNSVAQNRARSASLQYILDNGGSITDAVKSQRWPGEANVYVSLVNWQKGSTANDPQAMLDGHPSPPIGGDLRAATDRGLARILAPNAGRAFYGPVPIGKGFVVTAEVAASLIEQDSANRDVVRPFLTGADIVRSVGSRARRWCIDFGTMTLEQAQKYPAPLAVLRRDVKPERERNNRPQYRRNWWLFGEPCKDMRRAIGGLDRHIVGVSTGKRAAFVWSSSGISMNNSTVVFAFDDDFSMGVLQSRSHRAWALSQSSTLKEDLRYTPSSVFNTFPWPSPTRPRRVAVEEAVRELISTRASICEQEQIGLTTFWNRVDEGGYAHVTKLQGKLDAAVARAYGWPQATVHDDDEIVRRLLDLNHEIAQGGLPYVPFGSTDALSGTLGS